MSPIPLYYLSHSAGNTFLTQVFDYLSDYFQEKKGRCFFKGLDYLDYQKLLDKVLSRMWIRLCFTVFVLGPNIEVNIEVKYWSQILKSNI